MGYFVFKKTATGVKFDLVAGNHEVIATSEVYKSEPSCRKGIASVRRNAPIANLQDMTEEPVIKVSCPKFEVYVDKGGEYRFRLKATNGQIIAVSEGYAAKAGCMNGIESVRKNAAGAIMLLDGVFLYQGTGITAYPPALMLRRRLLRRIFMYKVLFIQKA